MADEEFRERRRKERKETDIGLNCRIPAQPSKARILDLSHSGCRVELGPTQFAERGATILLDIPNGDRVNGQIMWLHRREAGVRFSRQLPSRTAVFLGIEEPVETQVVVTPAAEQQVGLLHHWFRRISKIF